MATALKKSGKEMPAATPEREAPPSKLLVLELEEAVDGVREVVVRALASALKDSDAKKIEEALLRYGLCAAPDQAARSILSALGVRTASHESIRETVREKVADYFQREDCKLRPAVTAAMAAVEAAGGRTVFLSASPEGTAMALAGRLGLAERGAKVSVAAASEGLFPGADLWLRAAREAGCPFSQTLAVVTTRTSCKSALIAGIRCVVVPDRFTAHQDFGGASAVFSGAHAPARSDFAEVL